MKRYTYQERKNICGNRVREMRRKKELTQEALAAKLQVKEVVVEQNGISRIENGTRFVTDYELMVFAKIFGVSMQWLVGEEEP